MDLETRVRALEDKIRQMEDKVRLLTVNGVSSTLGSKRGPVTYAYWEDPKQRGQQVRASYDADAGTLRFERS